MERGHPVGMPPSLRPARTGLQVKCDPGHIRFKRGSDLSTPSLSFVRPTIQPCISGVRLPLAGAPRPLVDGRSRADLVAGALLSVLETPSSPQSGRCA